MPQPSYSTANGYIGENYFTVFFNAALDSTNPPLLNAFNAQVNGTDATLSSITVDSVNQTVTLVFNAISLLAGDVIDFVYTDPTVGNDVNALQGLDGSDAASFSQSIVVAIIRPGPSAPSAPTLDPGSDSATLGDSITSDNTPTVNGTSEANATVRLYDTDGTTLLGTTTADGSGNWSVTSSALGHGSHTLRVTQTNGLSQTSPLSAGLTLTIDTSVNAPTSLAVAAGSDSGTLGDGISNVGTPTITGLAEANATVRLYDTDGTTLLGTATANGAGAWSIVSSNLTSGSHTLTARQTDVAGNVSAASSGFTYVLDTIGPVSMALSTNSVDVSSATNGSTVATLSSTDITSVTYGFAIGNGVIDADNGRFSISGTSLVAAQNLASGSYYIYLSATDAAGNDAFQIFTINVTNTPSVSSIVRAGGASATVATSATSVDYTVTFSQPVTGVDASDFTLTASGSASGSVASVTGSGSTYTVSVDGIAGDGTLRLDLNASGTGIVNGTSVPIAGGYTSGQTYTLDHTAPTTTIATMAFSADTGISNTDFITATAAQTISGTLSANLLAGEVVEVSLDNGSTWSNATATVGQNTWSLAGVTLSSSDALKVRVSDAAENHGTVASQAYVLDTQGPTATIGLSDTALVPGETSQVTITFSEAVSGFTNADLTVPNGTLSIVSSGNGGVTWTATYTPSDMLLDGSNLITLDNTGVSDAAGNAGTGTTDSVNFTIDTTDNVAPVLASAVANGNLLVLTYSDVNALNAVNMASSSAFSVISGGLANVVTGVAVNGAAKTVTLTLETAVLQGEAVTVSYTDPTAGNDANATQDVAGNDAASFVDELASNITAPDGTPPTATLSVDDIDLSAGETTTVTINFNEPVADLTLADLSAGSGVLLNLQQVNAKTWTAVLQPFVNVNAAGNVVQLDASGIHDRSGNAGEGSFSSNSYSVRTLDPVASIMLADSQLSSGETTEVTISFASAVSGLDLGDFSVQGGSLGGLGSSDGGLTWRATFTPTGGYSSATNVIVLNHAGISTAQGQPGSGSTSSGRYAVDTLAPSLTIVSDGPLLSLGQSATLSFNFSETPSGFGAEDITVRGGSLSALTPTADPRVYTAQFTPSDAINGVSVLGTGYSDLAGNRGSDASFSGPSMDTSAPVFYPAASSPADDAAAVPVGSTLVLQFSEALSPSQSSLGSVTLRHLSDGALVPATVALNASGNLVIDPSDALAYDSDYAVAWDAFSLKDAAGNAVAALLAGSSYNFHTAAAPTSGSGTQDGVPVSTVFTLNADGSTTETVSTPPVPATRPEDPQTPNAALADVVVAKAGDGSALLTVSLPVGVGVRSEATTGGNLTLRQQLVNATTAHESDPVALQALIDAGIDQYVPTVADPSQVTVRTLVLQPGTGSGGGGAAPIRITGAQGQGEGSSEHPLRHEALVIDASNLPPGTVLQLDNVEFAIIIGASRLLGGNGSNVVFGDGSRQFIVLGADDDQLHGGAGDDTVGSMGGNDTLYGDAGNDHLVGGSGNDTLDGGAGDDVLQGGPSDAGTWTVQLDVQGRVLSCFVTAEAALGGPTSNSYIGPWTLPGQPQDSDDRVAYTYESAQRLQDVAMLYRAATGALPSLDELNRWSTSDLTTQQLAQAAYDHYAAGRALPQAIEMQVKALIETVWGAGTASEALVAMGTNYLTQGGGWADALLYLARDALSLQGSTDSQGNLNLAQPLVTSELGWNPDAGNDVLSGGEGDDRLVGGRGSDVLDGGAGTDTVVFTGNVRDYHFHKTTVNGVAQLVMQSYGGTDVDTLISVECWEIGSKTYQADSALTTLADNVDMPLAAFLVELVGQGALPADNLEG